MMRPMQIIAILWIGISLISCETLHSPVPPLEMPTPVSLKATALPTAETLTPTLLPQSPQIAFISTESGLSQIYRISSNDTDPVQLTFDENKKAKPAWSPDGGKLLYQVKLGGIWQIAMMNWDGSDLVQLTSEGNNHNPSWSPDGKSILFDSDRNGDLDIFRMESNGANQMALTNYEANEFAPAYSPDGNVIAYLSEQDATVEDCTQGAIDGCPQEVFLLDSNGQFLSKVPDLKAYIGSVAWSPDSRFLAILTSYFEHSEIVIYDLQSKGISPLMSLSEILELNYPSDPGYFYLRSFSFSPSGDDGVFCAKQDISDKNSTRMVYSGCYIVNLGKKTLSTLVRKETSIHSNADLKNAIDYSDATWQPWPSIRQ